MNEEDQYGDRLRTHNFKPVHSRAVNSIDYDQRLKIIEIEYKSGDVYHYKNMNKKEWEILLEIIKNPKGLGEYLNKKFKPRFESSTKFIYYRLIVVSDTSELNDDA